MRAKGKGQRAQRPESNALCALRFALRSKREIDGAHETHACPEKVGLAMMSGLARRFRRCAYHENVMKTLEPTSSTVALNADGRSAMRSNDMTRIGEG